MPEETLPRLSSRRLDGGRGRRRGGKTLRLLSPNLLILLVTFFHLFVSCLSFPTSLAPSLPLSSLAPPLPSSSSSSSSSLSDDTSSDSSSSPDLSSSSFSDPSSPSSTSSALSSSDPAETPNHPTTPVPLPPLPPSITKQTSETDIIFDSREDLLLECEGVAEPAPTFQWRKNGAVLNVDADPRITLAEEGKGTFVVKNPDQRDEGYYQCIVSNRVGVSMSNVVFVRAAFLDQMPKVTSVVRREGRVGGHATLTCTMPRALPASEMFWTHMGEDSGFESVTLTESVAMDPKGNIHFLNLSPSDGGDEDHPYTCNIYNSMMRSIQQGDDQFIDIIDADDADAAAQAPPTLVWRPENPALVLVGATLSLECIFAGNPTPKITWKGKEGKEIKTGGRISIASFGQEIIVENANVDDAGKYECVGDNGVGAPVSHVTDVSVEMAPFFTTAPKDRTEAEEDTATILCEAVGYPEPDVRFFRNGIPIEDETLDSRYEIEDGGKKITIKELTQGIDDAVFQCNASNVHGYAFADAFLRVLAVPPIFSAMPETRAAAVEERRVLIPCVAYGVPKPKITWTFLVEGGAELTREIITRNEEEDANDADAVDTDDANDADADADDVTSNGRFVSTDAGLVIEGAVMSDAGVYTCHARNKFGAVKESGVLAIYEKTIVQVARTNVTLHVMAPPPGQIVEEDEDRGTARFECRVTVDDRLEARVEWEKNGNPLEEVKKASSGGGSAMEVTRLTISPREVTSSLTISAASRFDEGEFSCVAKTKLDEAKDAVVLEVFDVPSTPEPPVFLSCEQRSINLSISAPKDDGGAPILGYVLQRQTGSNVTTWRTVRPVMPLTTSSNDSSSDDGEVATMTTTTSEVLLDDGIHPWNVYAFRVAAENTFGLSDFSEPSLPPCSTPPDVPGANPHDVNGIGTAPDVMTIEWTPVPRYLRNGPDFHYVVKYRRQLLKTHDAVWTTEIVDDADVSRWIVREQPEAFVPYDIVVVAFNDEGQANEAPEVTTGWTGEGIPDSAPVNFECEPPSTPRKTSCSWDKYSKEAVRGNPVGFEVRHWVAGEKESTLESIMFSFDSLDGEIETLTPYSTMRLELVVKNGAFASAPSEAVELETPEGAPGPVSRLEAKAVGEDRMKVTWLPPSEPNGVVTGYKVSYIDLDANGNATAAAAPIVLPQLIVDETLQLREGLEQRRRYRILVTAVTSAGDGEENFVEETTTVLVPPDPPNIELKGYDEGCINVTLLPSNSENAGADFFIEFKSSTDEEWQKTEAFQTETPQLVVVPSLSSGTIHALRAVASNGESLTTASVEELSVTTLGYGPDVRAGVPPWLVIVIAVCILLFIILCVICLIKRNRGGKYPVQKKEREAGYEGVGGDPAASSTPAAAASEKRTPPQNGDFHRLRDEEDEDDDEEAPFGGSQTSLASSTRRDDDDDDDDEPRDNDSLVVYNLDEPGVDVSKFNEDGSFIGEYGRSKNLGESIRRMRESR